MPVLQDAQRVLLARRLDDPRQHQLPEYLVTPGGLRKPECVIGPGQGVPQVSHPRGGDLQQPGRPRLAQVEAEFQLPGREPLPGSCLQASSSASSCAEPMCSIFRDPRRNDHTIWTAVAPDEVFTVRTYATRRDYEQQPG